MPAIIAVAIACPVTFPKLRVRLITALTTPYLDLSTAPMVALALGAPQTPIAMPFTSTIAAISQSEVSPFSVESAKPVTIRTAKPRIRNGRVPYLSESRPPVCAPIPIPTAARNMIAPAVPSDTPRKLTRKIGNR